MVRELRQELMVFLKMYSRTDRADSGLESCESAVDICGQCRDSFHHAGHGGNFLVILEQRADLRTAHTGIRFLLSIRETHI